MHHHDVYCDNDMHISDFVLTSLANCTFESVALHVKNFTVSVHILFALCDEFPDIWRSIGKSGAPFPKLPHLACRPCIYTYILQLRFNDTNSTFYSGSAV